MKGCPRELVERAENADFLEPPVHPQWPSGELTGEMYGPPPDCKRFEVERGNSLRKCATVEFDNDDAGSHNVTWASVGGNKKLSHNLGTFPTGQKATFKFEHPGVVPIRCSLHLERSASPYFAETDQILGDYFIANVQDGDYKAFVWHEGKPETSQVIKVAGNTKMDFSLK